MDSVSKIPEVLIVVNLRTSGVRAVRNLSKNKHLVSYTL